MKRSELKAKFNKYTKEEKWKHYLSCKKKIKKLRHQLNDQAKNIKDDIENCLGRFICECGRTSECYVVDKEDLDNIFKKYGGENGNCKI